MYCVAVSVMKMDCVAVSVMKMDCGGANLQTHFADDITFCTLKGLRTVTLLWLLCLNKYFLIFIFVKYA